MCKTHVPPLVVPKKDLQTVRADGTPVGPAIHDVFIKRLTPLEDERGEINEIYRSEWGVHNEPLVYAYHAMIRPGKAKGWILHQKQDDRLYHMLGRSSGRSSTTVPTRGATARFRPSWSPSARARCS